MTRYHSTFNLQLPSLSFLRGTKMIICNVLHIWKKRDLKTTLFHPLIKFIEFRLYKIVEKIILTERTAAAHKKKIWNSEIVRYYGFQLAFSKQWPKQGKNEDLQPVEAVAERCSGHHIHSQVGIKILLSVFCWQKYVSRLAEILESTISNLGWLTSYWNSLIAM